MEKTLILHHPKFNTIRVFIDNNSRAYFGATDVACALGFANPCAAIRRYCMTDEILHHRYIDSNNRNQMTKFLTFDSLRDFVMETNRADAEAFWRWIVDEAIPVIAMISAYPVSAESTGSTDMVPTSEPDQDFDETDDDYDDDDYDEPDDLEDLFCAIRDYVENKDDDILMLTLELQEKDAEIAQLRKMLAAVPACCKVQRG